MCVLHHAVIHCCHCISSPRLKLTLLLFRCRTSGDVLRNFGGAGASGMRLHAERYASDGRARSPEQLQPAW